MFFFYLFVSEAVLPCVLCQELAIVFLCHLSLSPQRVITEPSCLLQRHPISQVMGPGSIY